MVGEYDRGLLRNRQRPKQGKTYGQGIRVQGNRQQTGDQDCDREDRRLATRRGSQTQGAGAEEPAGNQESRVQGKHRPQQAQTNRVKSTRLSTNWSDEGSGDRWYDNRLGTGVQ